MNYQYFETYFRFSRSQTFDIVIKQSNRFLLQLFIDFLQTKSYLSSFSTSEREGSKVADFNFIFRYFDGKEMYWPSFKVIYKDIRLECFLEKEKEIVLWFNDRNEDLLNENRFTIIKDFMKEVAAALNSEVFFMNEDAINRYILFSVTPNGNESNIYFSGDYVIRDKDYN